LNVCKHLRYEAVIRGAQLISFSTTVVRNATLSPVRLHQHKTYLLAISYNEVLKHSFDLDEL